MFLASVTNWTSVLNTDIPFVTEVNSNSKVANDNGTINLKSSGYWNVDSSLTITSAIVQDITVTLYVDGVAKATTFATETVATADDYVNVSIVDAIKTVLTAVPNDFATISLRVSVAGATVSGKIRVEYLQ